MYNHLNMRELQRKQRIKRLVYSFPSLIVLAAICFFLVKGAVGIMKIERESAQRVSELEGQTASLKMRETNLRSQISKLQSEEGIIEEIKRKFSAPREGEHVAIIVDDRNASSSDEDSQKIWYQRLWAVIIGK